MSWKEIAVFVFFLIVVALLVVYWFFPLGQIEFRPLGPVNTNFSLNPSAASQMQFYENMRYPDKYISYKIEKCTLQKADDMRRAFEMLESVTVLEFYPVSTNEEIIVTCTDRLDACDDGVHNDPNVAGCGGPTKVTESENFNVIHNGNITLIKDSKCAEPIVALHELLHALGFDHSENPDNVMYLISDCGQEIGEDIPETINYLYSFPSYSDLAFEDASAIMHGRYLDISVTIRNDGLMDSEESNLIIYFNDKVLKEFEVESIQISGGRIITLRNILVLQTGVDKLDLIIDYDFPELDKSNNKITLEVNG